MQRDVYTPGTLLYSQAMIFDPPKWSFARLWRALGIM